MRKFLSKKDGDLIAVKYISNVWCIKTNRRKNEKHTDKTEFF
jgi:hypothetical protein